jgi:pseudaminic acid cytidylyltransferase
MSMKESKGAIAIITARGGSKRIPRKNIRDFNGRPIISYSIEAAIASGIFDEIMVSTDDDEIAQIAKRYGANVPFMRSNETANDFASTADVLFEVINRYNELGLNFSTICCIYPTAPFITSQKLQKGYALLENGIDEVLPVVAYSFPPQRCIEITNNKAKMRWPEHKLTRSQDLDTWYHDCGQFYFLNTNSFMIQKSIMMENTVPMIISELEVQDIDNEDDWKLAELKYCQMISKEN